MAGRRRPGRGRLTTAGTRTSSASRTSSSRPRSSILSLLGAGPSTTDLVSTSESQSSSSLHNQRKGSSAGSGTATRIRKRTTGNRKSDLNASIASPRAKRPTSSILTERGMAPDHRVEHMDDDDHIDGQGVSNYLQTFEERQSSDEEYEDHLENSSSFDNSSEDLENNSERREEEDDNNLENEEFKQIEKFVNAADCLSNPQMNMANCSGIGSPDEVWSLMCRRDDFARPKDNFVSKHVDLTNLIRAMVVDWVMEVCQNENQHRETFHLAVDYIDRFLDSEQPRIVRRDLQLFATIALFAASKYEEIYPPKLNELVLYTDGACNEEQVLNNEVLFLKTINWNLNPVTAVSWLGLFLQLLGHRNNPIVNDDDEDIPARKHLTIQDFHRDDYIKMANILDVVLLDYDSHRYSYRQLAAAAMFLCVGPIDVIEEITGYRYDEMQPIVEWISPFAETLRKIKESESTLSIPEEESRNPERHTIQTHHMHELLELLELIEGERKIQRENNNRARRRFPPRRLPAPLQTISENAVQA